MFCTNKIGILAIVVLNFNFQANTSINSRHIELPIYYLSHIFSCCSHCRWEAPREEHLILQLKYLGLSTESTMIRNFHVMIMHFQICD